MNRPTNLTVQALAELSDRTLTHYNHHAQAFLAGTQDHDVSQNIKALLRFIEGAAPFAILDFGCGPGRDLKAFTALGHTAVGLDGAARFADMARAYSGCEVWLQDFLALDLPAHRFDGVFANASLFHVPSLALPQVLSALHATLKPRGVLFCSNPRGHNEEGWNRDRYGTYHDLPGWRRYMTEAGFAELLHYYRPPGLPIDQQPWLASVWRRVKARVPAVGAQELVSGRNSCCRHRSAMPECARQPYKNQTGVWAMDEPLESVPVLTGLPARRPTSTTGARP